MTILLYNFLQYGYFVKKWLKLPQHKEIKPLDCGFCTAFWIGTIISIITLTPMLLFTNFIFSYYYGTNQK